MTPYGSLNWVAATVRPTGESPGRLVTDVAVLERSPPLPNPLPRGGGEGTRQGVAAVEATLIAAGNSSRFSISCLAAAMRDVSGLGAITNGYRKHAGRIPGLQIVVHARLRRRVLVLIVPILLFSLYTVKVRKNFTLHRNLQLLLGIVLLVAVAAFRSRSAVAGGLAGRSQQRGAEADSREARFRCKTALCPSGVRDHHAVLVDRDDYVFALRRFPNPPQPGPHSRLHKTLGWLSTIDITLTSVTGLVFYYFAFVSR